MKVCIGRVDVTYEISKQSKLSINDVQHEKRNTKDVKRENRTERTTCMSSISPSVKSFLPFDLDP